MVSHEAAYEIAELEAKNTVPCVHQCGRMFPSKNNMDKHKGFRPNVQWPQPCSKEGCESTSFASMSALRRHNTETHSNNRLGVFIPQPCSHKDCSSDEVRTIHQNENAYKAHITRQHGNITGANLQSLIVRRLPGSTVKAPTPPLTQQKSNPLEDKTTKYSPSPCLVDGCTARGGDHRFRDWESYKRHLLSKKKPGHAYDLVDDHDVLLEHFRKTRIPK